MIRSFLISAKEGVGLGSFANDYRVMCGEEVPYREFGTLSILLNLESQLCGMHEMNEMREMNEMNEMSEMRYR